MTPSESYSIISEAAIKRYIELLIRENADPAYIADVQTLLVQYAALVSTHQHKQTPAFK